MPQTQQGNSRRRRSRCMSYQGEIAQGQDKPRRRFRRRHRCLSAGLARPARIGEVALGPSVLAAEIKNLIHLYRINQQMRAPMSLDWSRSTSLMKMKHGLGLVTVASMCCSKHKDSQHYSTHSIPLSPASERLTYRPRSVQGAMI